MLVRPGEYVVSFRIRILNTVGFKDNPLKLSLWTSHGHDSSCERFLYGDQLRCQTVAPLRSADNGHWLELDIGQFSVETEMPLSLQFSLSIPESLQYERGLVVDGVKLQLADAVSGSYI
jgi:hypothetical protein